MFIIVDDSYDDGDNNRGFYANDIPFVDRGVLAEPELPDPRPLPRPDGEDVRGPVPVTYRRIQAASNRGKVRTEHNLKLHVIISLLCTNDIPYNSNNTHVQ